VNGARHAAAVAATRAVFVWARRARAQYAQQQQAWPQWQAPNPSIFGNQAPPPLPVPHVSLGLLSSHLGVSVAVRELDSGDVTARRIGIERLGAIGSPRALDTLVGLLASGVSLDSRDLLVAVRALAPHAAVPEARQALVRLMGHQSGSGGDRADPLLTWVRQSAAAALAASHTRPALEALGEALRQNGPAAEAALEGLLAHPPRDLEPVLEARGMPSVTFVRALARLGDQRAFATLRTIVRGASPRVRAEAAVALTELGDLETVALARYWLAHDASTPERVAAARILALTHAPGAAAAIGSLLASEATERAGLELALSAPQPELVDKLEALLAHADEDDVPRILGAIGRAGGPRAAQVLERELAQPRRAAAAAYVLALDPDRAAREVLEHALGVSATARTAACAAVVRHVALDDDVGGLRDALERLLASHAEADRAAGAWGQAVLDPARRVELLGARDPWLVRAAARAALDARSAGAAAARLSAEKDPTTRAALAIALVHRSAQDRVPTARLLELIDDGGAATPIAVLALAARDDATLRPRIRSLLASGDPLLRAEAALGLGASAEASAVGLLEDAYRFEPSPSVRHAIIVALSQSDRRSPTLRLAAELDGSEAVREAARRVLAGQGLRALETGSSTFWMSLVENSPATDPTGRARSVILVAPGGLALPLVADPDGLVTVAGLGRGPVQLRLAPARDNGKAQR
jgi:HEAT repeat protein